MRLQRRTSGRRTPTHPTTNPSPICTQNALQASQTLMVFFMYSCCAVDSTLLMNQYRVRPLGTLSENQPIMKGMNLSTA